MSDSEKVRENRARRALERRGLRLVKSRRRDPDAIDYAMHLVLDEEAWSDGYGVFEPPPMIHPRDFADEGYRLHELERALAGGQPIVPAVLQRTRHATEDELEATRKGATR